MMIIESLRFWRRVYSVSSLAWASYVAYPSGRQPRPDDGMSRGKTPTSSFLYPFGKGCAEQFNRGNELYERFVCSRRERTCHALAGPVHIVYTRSSDHTIVMVLSSFLINGYIYSLR